MKRANEPIYAMSILLATTSIGVLPILFGPISFILAIIIICKGDVSTGLWALLNSIVCPIVGAALGFDSIYHATNNFDLAMWLIITNVIINLAIFFFMIEKEG